MFAKLLQLVSNPTMQGAVPLRSLRVFMAWCFELGATYIKVFQTARVLYVDGEEAVS
jgi:hypothetical protein